MTDNGSIGLRLGKWVEWHTMVNDRPYRMMENDKWWTNAKWQWGMTDNVKWLAVGKNR